MSELKQTKRELVRILVAQHGLQKAAELAQVPYATVRQWESRRKRKAAKSQPNLPVSQIVTSPISDVANRVESELKQLENKTKLSLAKSVNRMATDAESVSLREAPYVHKAAQTASIVHGWNNESNKAPAILNLGVLIGEQPKRVERNKSLPDIDAELAD